MKDVVLVKLGGSVLTDKTGDSVLRSQQLSQLANEVAVVARSPEGPRVVLGHGSGSFGHVTAVRSGLVENSRDGRAISETQSAAARLHRSVIQAFLEFRGLAPFSLAPSAGFVASNGRIVEGSLEPLTAALEQDMMPVVYGDVVVDREKGSSICSTEEVFRYLCEHLGPLGYRVDRVVWVGVTDGVVDRSGQTIARIDQSSWDRVEQQIGTTRGTDVTGGMLLRLRMCRALAAAGIESLIVNGSVAGALTAALQGKQLSGTTTVTAE